MQLHHVQVAMPPGAEAEARAFWGDLLGMEEIDKPTELAKRGGCWFRLGTAEIHCGVEDPFSPALKAHPALVVDDLELLAGRLRRAGLETRPDALFPGRERFYVDDPFGNRVEILGPELEPDATRPHPFAQGAWYRVRRTFGLSAPGASFEKGELLRFVHPGGYSRYDGAHLYVFEDGAAATREVWWFDSDELSFLKRNLEPSWPPELSG